MLRHQLPSASSLFTFEAVARLRSFSEAAHKLNVTQPAVSRSIKNLESHLGYPLFKRHGRWIKLTPNGDKLFRATSTAFNTVTDALRDIDQQQERCETITISMSATSVNYWFIPRMSDFNEKFPTVGLDFKMYSKDDHDPLHDVDLGIRLSSPEGTDLHRWPYSDEKIIALCSPEYLSENGTLDKPKEGRTHTLIEQLDPRYSLDEFFHSIGLNASENAAFVKFSDYSSILQATLEGHGIALAWLTDASKQIVDGNLVPACTQVVKTGRRYHVVASNLRPMRPVAEDMRDWLISEMRNDQKKIVSILKTNWDLF